MDATHLLKKNEELKESLLVTWDVVAMFPNNYNNLCITAITEALNSHANNFPSTDCIVKATQIYLEHNNSQFNTLIKGQYYLQIHGRQFAPKTHTAMRLLRSELWVKTKSGELSLTCGGDTRMTFFIIIYGTTGTTETNDRVHTIY